jgi:predicted neutral ceramidase superfamily lipid hydrolase
MSGSGDTTDRLGPSFWVGLVIGGAIMAFGVRGALAGLGAHRSLELAEWVVGLDVAHDLLLAPVVVAVGLFLAWLVPATIAGPVRAAVAISGLVVLFSVPLITAWGRHPANSSTLPLNYAHSVLIVLGLIWFTAATVIIVRMARNRRVIRFRSDLGGPRS